MTNYRKEWAEGEIEAGTLLDAIDELNARIQEARELFEDINFNRQGIVEAKVEAWMEKTFFKG